MSESVTVLYARGEARIDDALAEGGDLWLRLDDLTRASGWALKPEGACLGEVCVPLPAGRRGRFVRDDGPDARFNLPELARMLDMPVVADSTTRTWCFGESAPARGKQRESLKAPDFTLPDLEGRAHALSDYRGKKVFLVAWASW
jgi:hypothetical protein